MARPHQGIVGADGEEELGRLVVVPAAVGGDRPAEGERQPPGDARGPGRTTRRALLERLEHPLDLVEAPRPAEGHHVVRLGERERVVLDLARARLRELLPALAHVHVPALEPPQHGRAVLDVEVKVGRLRAEAPVVEGQHLVDPAPLDLEHREVPPQVLAHRVAVVPDVGRPGEPLRSFAQPPLHLEDVGHGVDGPHVVLVHLDGPAPVGLGPRVVPALLEGEAVHPEEEPVPGAALVPRGEHARDRVAHPMGAAEPEGGVVLEPQGEEVVGMVDEDPVPHEDRARLVAFVDRAERLDHQPLARRRDRRPRLGFGERLADLPREEIGLKAGQQDPPQAVRHRALGVGFQHRLSMVDRVEAELEVAPDGRVVRGERGGRVGGEVEPVGVTKHARTPAVIRGTARS